MLEKHLDRPFSLGQFVVPLQTMCYPLENGSFVHLKIIHSYARNYFILIFFLRHLNERKLKMKEKRRSSEENTSFGPAKGVYSLVITKSYQ